MSYNVCQTDRWCHYYWVKWFRFLQAYGYDWKCICMYLCIYRLHEHIDKECRICPQIKPASLLKFLKPKCPYDDTMAIVIHQYRRKRTDSETMCTCSYISRTLAEMHIPDACILLNDEIRFYIIFLINTVTAWQPGLDRAFALQGISQNTSPQWPSGFCRRSIREGQTCRSSTVTSVMKGAGPAGIWSDITGTDGQISYFLDLPQVETFLWFSINMV